MIMKNILKRLTEKREIPIRKDTAGNEYVEHYAKTAGFSTVKLWFRLSDMDPDALMLYTALFGWCGLHKLREGNVRAFLGYLLTCGGFGVFYISDCVRLFFGQMSYMEISYEDDGEQLLRHKECLYIRPLGHKIRGLLLMLLSLPVSYLLLHTVYRGLYTLLFSGFVNALF